MKKHFKNIALYILIVINLSGLFFLIRYSVAHGAKDFCQDYLSAKYLMQHQSMYTSLYCYDKQFDYVLRYNTHPPFSVFLFLPFTFLSLSIASFFWIVISLGFYMCAVFLLLKILDWYSFFTFNLCLILSFFSIPFLYITLYQNYTQLLLFLLVLAWFLERRGKTSLAGFFIGVAGLVKIWPLVFLVGLFCIGKRKAACIGMLVFIVGTLVTVFVLDLHTYISYATTVRDYESFWIHFPDNISLVGFITRLFSGFYYLPPIFSGLPLYKAISIGEIFSVCFLCCGLFFVWLFHRYSRYKADDILIYSFLLSVIFVSFPVMWTWGAILLLLPFTANVLLLRRMKQPLWLLILFFFSFLLLFNPGWMLFDLWYVSTHHHLSAWTTWITELPTLIILLFIILQMRILLQTSKTKDVPA